MPVHPPAPPQEGCDGATARRKSGNGAEEGERDFFCLFLTLCNDVHVHIMSPTGGSPACTGKGDGDGDGSDSVVVAECVPDAFECTSFNDGAGCPSGTECGPKVNNQLAHRGYVTSL